MARASKPGKTNVIEPVGAEPVEAEPVGAEPVEAEPVGAEPVGAGQIGASASTRKPTKPQRAWLTRGLDQPGGKLPLFEEDGRRVNQALIRSCLEHGWAERWFDNPLKPDWLICRLTDAGRDALGAADR